MSGEMRAKARHIAAQAAAAIASADAAAEQKRRADCYDDLLSALNGLIGFSEAAETKMLVGDEGCLWPVEAARAAIAKATEAQQ